MRFRFRRYWPGCVVLLTAIISVLDQLNAQPPENIQAAVSNAPVVKLYSVGKHSSGATSHGSGFIIDEHGTLVTARHICAESDALFAFTADGKKYPVTGFLGEDFESDVAVLQIEGAHFLHFSLASSNVLQG